MWKEREPEFARRKDTIGDALVEGGIGTQLEEPQPAMPAKTAAPAISAAGDSDGKAPPEDAAAAAAARREKRRQRRRARPHGRSR
jgi:hypothetical protein